MIDYFMLFSSQTVAESDPTVGLYWDGSSWDLSQTFPGISVATAQAIINGVSALTGFWIIISTVAPVPALDTHSRLVMKLNRDLSSGSFVMSSVITGTNRTNLIFHPLPQGSNYPQPLGQ